MDLIQKLRYMGRQYAAGQKARGDGAQKHYLEEAADELERLLAATARAPPRPRIQEQWRTPPVLLARKCNSAKKMAAPLDVTRNARYSTPIAAILLFSLKEVPDG